MFYDYCNRRNAKDDEVAKQFMLNDKFFDLRKEFDTFVTRNEFSTVMKDIMKNKEGVIATDLDSVLSNAKQADVGQSK